MHSAERQLLRADDPQLTKKLTGAVAFVEANHAEIAERIARRLPAYLRKMDEMGMFLKRWLRCDLQWSPTPCIADGEDAGKARCHGEHTRYGGNRVSGL